MINYSRGSEWRRWDLHVHTASSYDAYKGADADDLLSQALLNNHIAAVAITDHFTIDSNRILHIRELAPDITFFPGVELRTDKGAANIHVILIFPETTNLIDLCEDFNVFKRTIAVNPTDNDRIYWDFSEIIKFAKIHNAFVSIHAGSKDKGVDDKISNALPINEAIKEDFARNVDFYEMGKIKDLANYKENVFPSIGEFPMLICSDNHNPKNYIPKEFLWIKADPTFEGLSQCKYQPDERVYIGAIPPKLDKAFKSKRTYIDHVLVKKSTNAKNTLENWFDFDIPINSGLTVIIGNKGSGKSALSDILGHFAYSSSMFDNTNASFLNSQRFRKAPQNLANDYEGNIVWLDGQVDATMSLGQSTRTSTIENAQYLPQKYIEKVCNELGDEFQTEINNVIFSYVDTTERGTAKTLAELVDNKSVSLYKREKGIQGELIEINKKIIHLEEKSTSTYLKLLEDNSAKRANDLDRQEKNKPTEVKKPDTTPKETYVNELRRLNEVITITSNAISTTTVEVTEINKQLDLLKILKDKLELIVGEIDVCNLFLSKNIDQFGFNADTFKILYTTPIGEINDKISSTNKQKNEKLPLIDNSEEADITISLYKKLAQLNTEKEKLISQTSSKEKVYQKYLSDYNEWEKAKMEIIGDVTKEGSIKYIKNEISYVKDQLPTEYENLKEERLAKIRQLYDLKQEKALLYTSIYEPIEKELRQLLKDKDDVVEFSVNVSISDKEIPKKLLSFIAKSYTGIFAGATESQNKMNELINNCDFNKSDDVCNFINNVLECVYENIDISAKKIKDKEQFYEMLTSLKYIDVEYNLNMNGKSLRELSAGQRGIVLLMFYLALSKKEIPIIIDQPEDNLDNQSVYWSLVPCIREAKKKRQIIIVTHNPNIAIACDAEEIIYCSIEKKSNKITYESGSIENSNVSDRVVKVLEGTMPAFNLRELKYSSLNKEQPHKSDMH